MNPVEDIAIAMAILEGAAKLAPAIADGLQALISQHRPDLTASAPPENQEQVVLDLAETRIRLKFPGESDR